MSPGFDITEATASPLIVGRQEAQLVDAAAGLAAPQRSQRLAAGAGAGWSNWVRYSSS